MGFEALEDRHLLSVSLSLNGPQTITPGATINVSNSGFGQSEMSIVVNPTNPLNVVGFSHRLTTPITMDVYRSFDGGATWMTKQITNADDGLGAGGGRFDPAVAFDGNGLLYIAYGVSGTAGPPATQTRLVGAVSTDGGANFINFRVIDAQNDRNGAGTAPVGVDKWYLTTGVDPDSGGQATYVSYVHFAAEGAMGTTPDDRIMVAGTRDGGANWTAPLNINDPSINGSNTGSSYASPVVGRLGELAVSWHDFGTDTIFLDRDMDGLWATGANFGADITVRTGVTVDKSVNLPPAQPERGINAAPMLEVYKNLGWLYMPYVHEESGADLDIFVGRSTDFGENWTFNRIDDSFGTEFNPWLQVDQKTGAVNVLYYTTDGDTATGNNDVRPRLASSFDNGNTWTRAYLSNQQSEEGTGGANDYGGDYLEYIGLAARDGTVHGLWASRYPGGGLDLDAFTANAALVSSTGDNRLIIGESGGVDDYFIIRQSPANPAYLEVFVDGVREFTGLSATLDKIIINPGAGVNTINIGTLTGISSITIGGTNDAETINLEALASGTPLTMVLGGGNDIVTLAPFNPFGVSIINAPVTIFGEGGDDTLNMGSGNVDAINASITFDGGAEGGSSNNRVTYHDTSPAYDEVYNIYGSSVTRTGLLPLRTLTYFNTQVINLQCGGGADTVNVHNGVTATVQAFGYGGPDTFIRGDGLLVAQSSLQFDGGGGTDTIIFDDHNNPTGLFWDIYPTQVIFGGAVIFGTTGFESVSVLAGMGNDIITLANDIGKGITVNGGGGGDAFILYDVSNFQDFDDTGQGGLPAFHYALDLDGGSGFNTLTVDDSASFDRLYNIRPSNVIAYDGAPLGMDFDYDNFQSMTFQAGAFIDEFYVFGTSPDIPAGQQIAIFGNDSPDSLILFPRDAQGNLAINCNITFTGGAGTDSVFVSDAGSSLGINYQMAGGTITGMGAGSVFVNGNESLTFSAGSGNDTWTTVSGPLANPPTTINAGGGTNTFNLDASLTPIAWTINGGPNLDTLNLIDSNNPSPSTSWTINATSITRTRSDGATLPKVYTHSAVDQIIVSGGASVDAFYVDAVAPGTTLTLNGGAGLDGVGLGFATSSLEAIQGLVVFNGGPGGGNLHALDSADTSGDTVHQDQTSLGAYPGDNLFGPGGLLRFSDIVNFDVYPGVQLTLGSGVDTIYAQPLPTGRVTIVANNPTSAPGDKLTLALAQAQNPIVTGTTNGNVTSTNLQTLDWTGIETLVAPDNVAPTVNIVDVTPDPRTTSVSSIAINFSEAVSGFSLADLVLTRNGGANLLPASATLTSGNQINWTLGNLGGLTNVSGNYLLSLTAAGSGITDVAGNPLSISATDSWTANIPELMGDANGDNVVDIFDVNVVSSNWGTAGPAGDVNHDGIVDIFDVNLISANWGMMGGGGGEAGGGAEIGLAADASSQPTAVPTTAQQAAASSPVSSSAAEPLRVAPALADATLPGDLNQDGRVDIFDVNLWSSRTGQSPHGQRKLRPALADLDTIKTHWGRRARAVDALFGEASLGEWYDTYLTS